MVAGGTKATIRISCIISIILAYDYEMCKSIAKCFGYTISYKVAIANANCTTIDLFAPIQKFNYGYHVCMHTYN